MKKFLVTITLACYLAVSFGVVINYHYCMNQLASTQLYGSESKVCGKCGMHTETSNGCCRDEVRIIKMEDDQKLSGLAAYELPAFELIAPIPSVFISSLLENFPVSRHHHNHSPPLLSFQDTYLVNGVFRI